MKPLSFGKQPAFNRFGSSRRVAAPAPSQHGDFLADPKHVLDCVVAQHEETRRPVPAQIVCVACNALSAGQRHVIAGVLLRLHELGFLEVQPGGFVPKAKAGGEV